MTRLNPRGAVYRCPVSGAELAVLAPHAERFTPRCCNVDMLEKPRKMVFYFCAVCGAEIGAIDRQSESFHPVCCNTDMIKVAS